MPTFDAVTASGTLNTQTETSTIRPTTLRTSTTTAQTIDTIAIPSSTGAAIECVIVGSSGDSERNGFIAFNNGAASMTTCQYRFLSVGDLNVWSTLPGGSGTAILSAVASGTNVLIKVKPGSATQTDWQLITEVTLV